MNDECKAYFDKTCKSIYESLNSADLNYQLFCLAYKGYLQLKAQKKLENTRFLTIIDYGRSSVEKRFYLIDLVKVELIYNTYVAHGINTGETEAEVFSNKHYSNQSSLGFFITNETYIGRNGYSLRLDGQEESYNNNARKRAIVIHGADYVDEDFIKKYGRLGRSFGCPALPLELNQDIINLIKGKSCLFIYYPDETYLEQSTLLNS